MIFEISWIAVIGAIAALLALFFTLKSFKMPSSFTENERKREEMRKKNADDQVFYENKQ